VRVPPRAQDAGMPLRRALALTALLALAPSADALAAKPKAKPELPQTATFRATLSGSQVSTWSYRRDPVDSCDASQTGDGSQMIRFKARPTRVTVMRDDDLAMVSPHLDTAVEVDREGDYKVGYPPAGQCPGDFDGGGSGTAPKDCGTRKGRGLVSLAIEDPDAAGSADDDLAPLVHRDRLWLTGDATGVSDFAECPFFIGGPADSPTGVEILQTFVKQKERDLFNRRRRTIKVNADYTKTYTAPGFTGKTLLTWNLRLVRIR
jgi:hypothetical protein